MARPTTKEDLMMEAKKTFEKLNGKIDALSKQEQEMSFIFEDRDKNIRDVIIHLFEWHKLWLSWVRENKKGNDHSFLPKPYNWRTYPDMNVELWKKHQNTSLSEARSSFNDTHQEVIEIIKGYTDQELFSKGVLKWTGGSTLGSYSTSVTSSHYQWAMKKINKHIKFINQ